MSTAALRVEVILQEIFSYLPTQVLLFTCSIVNKVWNREARKFVRNYRRCRIKTVSRCGNMMEIVPENYSTVPMEVFKGYDVMCGQIVGHGRVVPFNYMVVPEHWCGAWHKELESDAIILRNLVEYMKFKYLEIEGHVKVNCACGKFMVNLLTEKSSDVQTLVISAGYPTFKNLETLGWVPAFFNLEEVEITSVGMGYPPSALHKYMLRWLLGNAPHIKSVSVESPLHPPGILANEMGFGGRSLNWWKINIGTTPGLQLRHGGCSVESRARELNVFRPAPDFVDDRSGIVGNVLMKFVKCLEDIVRTNHKSVDSFLIFHGCALAVSPYAPRTNLKFLRLDHLIYNDSEAWKQIVGIDFGAKMPVLVKVYLSLETNYEAQYGSVVHAALTVRSLNISLGSKVTSIWPMPALFPNISNLNCTLMGSGNVLAEIFKDWCLLLDMNLSLNLTCGGKWNYENDFCGIDDEEMVLLREQDGAYLAEVHIVPVRPCLVTMPRK